MINIQRGVSFTLMDFILSVLFGNRHTKNMMSKVFLISGLDDILLDITRGQTWNANRHR